jgi:hypothetical protein
MRHPRLVWICKAVEYDKLTNRESRFIFNFVEQFMLGKFMSKTDEEKLENLFKEVQWREHKVLSPPPLQEAEWATV